MYVLVYGSLTATENAKMSLRCAREPANLLNRWYRLAHRQQENFVTESFTHLLHHLCHEHPDIGSRVIEWLAGPGRRNEQGENGR